MFIIDLKYKVPISEIENFLPAHVDFLDKNYESGNILMSGRKNPRIGGIIFSNLRLLEDVEKMIAGDPFKINNLADYTITEFLPTKTNESLKFLLNTK